ncbi:MAG: hypothetical protein GF308_07320 [Candidatus Heimdallarchaeota archaeon]|nr:hypothetical protein [Candidatus Heimdallarchaeota archaeon]
MIVIPVIDLLDNKVVRGIAGERKNYQPIKESVLCATANPVTVAKTFQKKLGARWLYIADLNRIEQPGKPSENTNDHQISAITRETSLKVMLDAGCQTAEEAKKITDLGIDQVIFGTETLSSIEELKQSAEKIGGERIILSIDLLEGSLLAKKKSVKNYSPRELGKIAEELALKAIIILDLRKVGSQAGPITESLLEISTAVKRVPVLTGGGVRNIDDLKQLEKKGIAGALLATALHKGSITKEDLKTLPLQNDW